MISDDGSSSSESETAADLIDSLLGPGSISDDRSPNSAKTQKAPRLPSSRNQPSANTSAASEEGAHVGASSSARGNSPQALMLELKGVPLQVDSRTCASGDRSEESLSLQPHQKLMRLSVDGDPSADPAELLAAYLAALKDNEKPDDVLIEKRIQVHGEWYLVQRGACRGELLLGKEPADTQLLTPERHLGHLTFSRCDPPEENRQEKNTEDNSWETCASFARFHKLQHYGANVKPKKPHRCRD